MMVPPWSPTVGKSGTQSKVSPDIGSLGVLKAKRATLKYLIWAFLCAQRPGIIRGPLL